MEKINKARELEQYGIDAFVRDDERPDREFYLKPRFVQHVDSTALNTISHIIGTLIVEESPRILDLMASWDSHIPEKVRPGEVIGLGLNEEELRNNKILTDYVIHDLNEDPTLPFPDSHFDVVINSLSVDYMTRPIEVFKEVGRILVPGGLFLVIFSNRYFPPKAVKIWKEMSEEERILLVIDYFKKSGFFSEPEIFISRGKPRPRDDRYAHMDIPSDPVYAVNAERPGAKGGPRKRPRPVDPDLPDLPNMSRDELKNWVSHTKSCPYCGQRLSKWKVPLTPFTEWDTDFFYVCFNDLCPYFMRGWMAMLEQGNLGFSYRFRYNPVSGGIDPMPVPHPRAYRESIVEDE
ncbi:class I SAM-dependent methyltransferase [Thermodesulforhabdus norvegica]|uniref:Methyltransferase domain-containing protein n=1 Tax=Thermodesulforhabdus norvegica TaxID=39841 RepID=A0A1I4VW74_9BACT|nr:methyltransferase domain-containing protein [Thermodesulforhabdus norvegica]SFN05400.1 Methyltransferase domain-containing protein [Thermodesulforhabdus norvegica]